MGFGDVNLMQLYYMKLLVAGQWFFKGIPASSINKT
jgi:hypothetical protein